MNIKEIKNAALFVKVYTEQSEELVCEGWEDLRKYDSNEDFIDAIKANHKEGARIMVDGYDGIPEELMDEDMPNENFYWIRERLNNLIDEDDWDAFSEYVDYYEFNLLEVDMYKLYSNFKGDYNYQWVSREAFAKYIANETLNVPKNIEEYFDYRKFSEHLFATDYDYSNGHVFKK